MTEALEWLIEHQDDPDEYYEDDATVISLYAKTDINEAGPSSSTGSTEITFKEACADLFSGNNIIH